MGKGGQGKGDGMRKGAKGQKEGAKGENPTYPIRAKISHIQHAPPKSIFAWVAYLSLQDLALFRKRGIPNDSL